MRIKSWELEPGDLILLALAGGLGFAWVFIGATLALWGVLGTEGSGSWNVLGPSLDPLGIVRTVVLLPIYATLWTAAALVRWGYEPGGALVVLLALGYGVGLGLLAGLAFVVELHVRG